MELQKVEHFYRDDLPLSVTIDNILNYESLTLVHCHHGQNNLYYFLTINIQFDLYYLEPLPTLIGDEYFTIIPNSKFLLKHKNQIRPLSEICTANGQYHCPSRLLTNNNITCETNILQEGRPKDCLYTKVHTEKDHLVPIPHVNQYLAWFITNSTIILQCPNEKRMIKPHGIFIIKPSALCKILFNGEQLQPLEPTLSSPIFIDFKMPHLKDSIQKSNMSIKLQELQLRDIKLHSITPIKLEKETSLYSINIWTIPIFSFAAILTILWLTQKYLLKPRSTRTRENQPVNQEDVNPRQLPSEASF